MVRSNTQSEISNRSSQLDFIANFTLAPNKDHYAYKNDKKCTVCSQTFTMIGKNKKKYCKFCFRGVCQKCSTREAFQRDLNARRRLCDNCYRKGMEESIKKNFQRQLSKQMNDVDTFQEVLMNERSQNTAEEVKLIQLRENLEKLREANRKRDADLRSRMQDLNSQIVALELQGQNLAREVQDKKLRNKRKETKIKGIKQKLQFMKENCSQDSQKMEQLKELISNQRAENIQLEKEMKQMNQNQETHEFVSIEYKLTLEVDRLTENKKQNKQRLNGLQKEKKELEIAVERKQRSIQELSEQVKRKSGVITSIYSQIGSEADVFQALKYLQDMIDQQQIEINQLTEQLSLNKSKTKNEETDLPAVRNRCKCLIQ